MSKKLTKNRLQLERRVLPQSLINTLHDIVANPKSAKQAAKTYGGTANRVPNVHKRHWAGSISSNSAYQSLFWAGLN